MRPVRRRIAIALLVAVTLVSAACSGSDGEGATADGQDTDAASGDGAQTGSADEAGNEGGASGEEGDRTGPEPTEAPEPVEVPEGVDVDDEATLVWVDDVEPPDLHLDDPSNGLPITSWIREGMLESLFGVDRNLAYYPELLAGEPTVTVAEDKSMVVDYTLRSGLSWSDGVPLTSADVAYTHDILIEGCETEADGSVLDGGVDGCIYRKVDRVGIEQVTAFEVTGETTFRVSFAKFYPDWRGLYTQIYAAHAYGETAAEVNRNLRAMTGPDGPLPGSGPLVFGSWERGRAITLVRNDGYHGSASPDVENSGPATVEAVRIAFAPDPQTTIDAMLTGAADLLVTRPDLELQVLTESEDVTVASVPGPRYEHWGLNLLNPHLAKPEVREAIAYGIDKAALIDEVYRPLYGDALTADGVGNSYWMPAQAAYANNQAAYDGPKRSEATAALEAAGYVTGSDGIYRHPIDGRLTLRVGTTTGNDLRLRQQDVLAAQLAEVGIEIEIDNVVGSYLQERPFAPEAMAAASSAGAEGDPGVWDIAQFAWIGGPWPGGQSGAYRIGGIGNPYGFANPEFDVAANDCDAVADDDERAACYNELDRFVTTIEQGPDGLFILPLTQKPSYVAYRTDAFDAIGVITDSLAGGPLVTVTDVRLAE